MTRHIRLTPVLCVLPAVALTAGLNGCAPPQRTEPPAPIVEARRPPPQPAAPQPSPEQPKPPEPTRVYAYQPPSDEPTGAGTGTETGTETADVPEPPADANAISGVEGADAPRDDMPTAATTPPPTPPVAKPKPTPTVPAPPPPESSASPSQAPTPAPAPPAPETQAPVETLAPQQLPPAVDALVRQAERQRQSSDYAGAAATLERALRLQSREAYLWNRLAHVRLEQGLATQAANLAARANDLSGDNASLRGDNWRVIANAKRRTGDLQGAQEAERRAASGG